MKTLNEILEAVASYPDGGMLVEEAKAAIIALVPEKMLAYDREIEDWLRTQGWNACREQMLKNLGVEEREK